MTEADRGEPNDEVLINSLWKAARDISANRSVRDVELTVDQLVRAAVETIPGAEGGGVSRTEQGTVRSTHATGDDIYALDQLQSELGEGPCITAADDPPAIGIVLAHDLAGADAERWPSFAPAAVEAGYRSLMSVGLSVDGKRRSALNIYARDPDVFDHTSQLVGGLFGIQAAMALHGADHAAQLGTAVASRDVIGQAKGILMERFTLTDDEAFGMLVSSSQDTNLKLVDVASWVVSQVTDRRAATGPQTPSNA